MAVEEENDADGAAIGSKEPKIVRGQVDSLTLYEVTEAELDVLEKGSPTSVYLNFAVLFLSIGASFFASLLASTVSDRVFLVFVVLTVGGLALGVCFLVLWWRFGSKASEVCEKIRDRLVQ